MRRTVTARLDLHVHAPALVAVAIAVADGAWDRQESLVIERDGHAVPVRELRGPHGTRLHQVNAPVGPLVVRYEASVDGRDATPPVDDADLLTYVRPSRYAESDALVGLARAELGHLAPAGGPAPAALLGAVADWVAAHVRYEVGSSGPTDAAGQTILTGAGVCRDFAHVTAAMLRALDVPARIAAVYAPGLSPMDFHAITEAYADGAWHLLDPTHLAPRASMLRIATGRDAADTAFLSTYQGRVDLLGQSVTAVVDALPTEQRDADVALR